MKGAVDLFPLDVSSQAAAYRVAGRFRAVVAAARTRLPRSALRSHSINADTRMSLIETPFTEGYTMRDAIKQEHPFGRHTGRCEAGARRISPLQAAGTQAHTTPLQRKASCACGGGCPRCAGPSIPDNPVRGLGPGQPLDAATRAFMEPRFGHDFGGVRVHTGGEASESARELSALAYTVGRDIVFSAGQYAPATDSGRRLLAHELVHVLQQSRGGSGAQVQRQAEQEGQPSNQQPANQQPSNQRPANQSCPSRDVPSLRCPDARVRVVEAAFNRASSWLGPAEAALNDYIAAPTDRRNRRVARALRRHFSWDESVRQRLTYPEVPAMVLRAIRTFLQHIASPAFEPACRSNPPAGTASSHGGLTYAMTGLFWQNNCYTFFDIYFNTRVSTDVRATVVLHEMAHNWLGFLDGVYEFESNYPGNVNSAHTNADPYAAFIRDVGRQTRGRNP